MVTQCFAGVVGRVANEVLERTLRQAETKSGRVIADPVAKQDALRALEKIEITLGKDGLKAVEDSGIEILESIPSYGDDLVKLTMQASPQARRAFAQNVPELLPLVRRVGIEVIELEAKVPGMAQKAFNTFGDDGARKLVNDVPAEDIPRLLKYAEKSDSSETRQVLLKTYSKEGKSLFERIPAGLVLSTGLTASMLYGTHRVTDPAVALGDAIRNNPKVAHTAIQSFIGYGAMVAFVIIVILLWRFGLMPWQRTATQREVSQRSN